MVGFVFIENFVGINRTCATGFHEYFKVAFVSTIDGVPLMEHLVFRELVYQTNELACFKVFCVIAFFKIIKFFKNSYWNTNVVFSKIEDGVVFINNYGCI